VSNEWIMNKQRTNNELKNKPMIYRQRTNNELKNKPIIKLWIDKEPIMN